MANEVELEKVSKSVFGITSRRYRQMANEEIVPLVIKGKIDFIAASKALIAYYRKLAEGQGSLSLTDVRTRKENARAEREELIVKKLKGELVLRNEAIKWVSLLVFECKAALWNIPRRLGPVLALISDEKECEQILRVEHKKALEELTKESKIKKANKRRRL